MINRENISDLFTPRQHEINSKMYIARPELEKHLKRSLLGSMHSFLFGESGNGKSWLFKKVMSVNKINFITINCANVSRKKSTMSDEIVYKILGTNYTKKINHSETTTTGANYIAKIESSSQDRYSVVQNDDLLEAFKNLSKDNYNKQSIIVFDNIETLFNNQELLNELSDMIILLDDDTFAKCNIKFLLVGVPNEVQKYFTNSKNVSSVSNRIKELPRVSGLSKYQVEEFVEKGFIKYLKINLSEKELGKISTHVYNVTLGVAQKVNEYCECLAFEFEDNHYTYFDNILYNTDRNWLFNGLRSSYAIIETYLNSTETGKIRRNQVIYSLSKTNSHQITTNEISQILQDEFTNSKFSSNSGIGRILSMLSKGENPLLKKVTHTDSYIITDPLYLMCIRIMLNKDYETEKVYKKNFTLN
jgi:hypothetical protein